MVAAFECALFFLDAGASASIDATTEASAPSLLLSTPQKPHMPKSIRSLLMGVECKGGLNAAATPARFQNGAGATFANALTGPPFPAYLLTFCCNELFRPEKNMCKAVEFSAGSVRGYSRR